MLIVVLSSLGVCCGNCISWNRCEEDEKRKEKKVVQGIQDAILRASPWIWAGCIEKDGTSFLVENCNWVDTGRSGTNKEWKDEGWLVSVQTGIVKASPSLWWGSRNKFNVCASWKRRKEAAPLVGATMIVILIGVGRTGTGTMSGSKEP